MMHYFACARQQGFYRLKPSETKKQPAPEPKKEQKQEQKPASVELQSLAVKPRR